MEGRQRQRTEAALGCLCHDYMSAAQLLPSGPATKKDLHACRACALRRKQGASAIPIVNSLMSRAGEHDWRLRWLRFSSATTLHVRAVKVAASASESACQSSVSKAHLLLISTGSKRGLGTLTFEAFYCLILCLLCTCKTSCLFPLLSPATAKQGRCQSKRGGNRSENASSVKEGRKRL